MDGGGYMMKNRFVVFLGFMMGLLVGVLATIIIISTEHQLF